MQPHPGDGHLQPGPLRRLRAQEAPVPDDGPHDAVGGADVRADGPAVVLPPSDGRPPIAHGPGPDGRADLRDGAAVAGAGAGADHDLRGHGREPGLRPLARRQHRHHHRDGRHLRRPPLPPPPRRLRADVRRVAHRPVGHVPGHGHVAPLRERTGLQRGHLGLERRRRDVDARHVSARRELRPGPGLVRRGGLPGHRRRGGDVRGVQGADRAAPGGLRRGRRAAVLRRHDGHLLLRALHPERPAVRRQEHGGRLQAHARADHGRADRLGGADARADAVHGAHVRALARAVDAPDGRADVRADDGLDVLLRDQERDGGLRRRGGLPLARPLLALHPRVLVRHRQPRRLRHALLLVALDAQAPDLGQVPRLRRRAQVRDVRLRRRLLGQRRVAPDAPVRPPQPQVRLRRAQHGLRGRGVGRARRRVPGRRRGPRRRHHPDDHRRRRRRAAGRRHVVPRLGVLRREPVLPAGPRGLHGLRLLLRLRRGRVRHVDRGRLRPGLRRHHGHPQRAVGAAAAPVPKPGRGRGPRRVPDPGARGLGRHRGRLGRRAVHGAGQVPRRRDRLQGLVLQHGAAVLPPGPARLEVVRLLLHGRAVDQGRLRPAARRLAQRARRPRPREERPRLLRRGGPGRRRRRQVRRGEQRRALLRRRRLLRGDVQPRRLLHVRHRGLLLRRPERGGVRLAVGLRVRVRLRRGDVGAVDLLLRRLRALAGARDGRRAAGAGAGAGARDDDAQLLLLRRRLARRQQHGGRLRRRGRLLGLLGRRRRLRRRGPGVRLRLDVLRERRRGLRHSGLYGLGISAGVVLQRARRIRGQRL
mmetsp:Transcript_11311/g.30942  ORF Transcript_11311/g.30942 Transcript_11311/m.30942 type:complete len:814 (-) Transcript_11311:421-2862(-)